jgi:hypothetical protein
MYGNSVTRKDVPPDAKVIHPIWTYSQKGPEEHKARKCMNVKQLVCMGVQFRNTYAACMEKHSIRLFIDVHDYIGNIIEDGDIVNAYAHADAAGTPIYIIVDEVYQSWQNSRYGSHIPLGACVPLHKAMRGHPKAGQWWEVHFDIKYTAPLQLILPFMEPTMYNRAETVATGPTLAIHQVYDVMVSAAVSSNRKAVLEGITSRVSFEIFRAHNTNLHHID